MQVNIPFVEYDTVYMVDKQDKSFKQFEIGARYNFSRGVNVFQAPIVQVNYPVTEYNQGAIVLHSKDEGQTYDFDNERRFLTTDLSEAKQKMMEIM